MNNKVVLKLTGTMSLHDAVMWALMHGYHVSGISVEKAAVKGNTVTFSATVTIPTIPPEKPEPA